MLKFIARRLLISGLMVWGVLTMTFFIIHLAPGDPLLLYVRPDIDPSVVENIRRQMGFNLPLWQQYFVWFTEFIQGNFAISLMQHRAVLDIFYETIPNTLRLTVPVFLIQLVLGIIIGVVTALKRNGKLDIITNSVLLFLYSMPGFWVALIAIMIFSLYLGWLPSSQMSSMHSIEGFWPIVWDRLRHLILPALVLSIPFITYTARFVRSSLIDVLRQPYIQMARAYGLRKSDILFKYALKNALLPVVTLIGLYIPFLLGGAVITEYIFGWPGMGRITVDALFAHDFPVILASNFIATLTVILGNLLSDILYLIVDPRIKIKQL